MRWLLEPNASLTAGDNVGTSVSSSGSTFCTGIAFAAVNHKSLYVPYIDDLLNRLKRSFLSHCLSIDDCDSFDKIFDRILMAVEFEGKKERRRLPPTHYLCNSPQEKDKPVQNIGIRQENPQVENDGRHSQIEGDISNAVGTSTLDDRLSDSETSATRSKLGGKRVPAGRAKSRRKAVGSNNQASTPDQTTTKKKGTVWHDGNLERKITKKAMESLDKSKARAGEGSCCWPYIIILYASVAILTASATTLSLFM